MGLKIVDGTNFLELKLLEILPDSLPTPGDRNIEVTLSCAGFTGKADVWLAQASIASFLNQLTELEQFREQEVAIESMSPNEFLLRVWFHNKLNHIAFDGYLAKRHKGLESKISFSLRPDTSMLKQYLDDLYSLLIR